jgi:thioredoxin-dependent adenylylsulfate APS reductase
MNAVTPILVPAPSVTSSSRPLVRIVIVGHVDHGKSTLIGRLLYETNSLPEGKLEHIKAVSARRGMPFEWSFVLDALQAERDQNITIDTSQIRFRTRTRDFVLIDAPGHAEFLRNMITGAAQADAAVLVIDAGEGVREQTRRHGYLLHLLGIRQLIVAVNKMDRVNYDAGRFREFEAEIRDYLGGLGLDPKEVIPVSARDGVGITEHTFTAEWYRPTIVEALDKLSPARAAPDLALRLPLQAVYKFDDRRILAGRIESGRLAVGDEVIAQPSGEKSRVRSIEAWPVHASGDRPEEASAGQSIGITLDDPLFVERGHLLSHAEAPARTAHGVHARVFWLHDVPLEAGARIRVGVGTASERAVISAVYKSIDPGQIAPVDSPAIGKNHVGEIELAFDRAIGCDTYSVNPATGRIVLEYQGRIAGGGLILETHSTAQTQILPTASAPFLQRAEKKRAEQLSAVLNELRPAERIKRLRESVDGKIVFTTSFGLEDQVILHWIADLSLDIEVVTIDAGRLFPETYAVWAQTEKRYGRRIRALFPDHNAIEPLVARQGINGFYESVDARISCCHIRKVEPLKRALAGAEAWITGLRADQSVQRASVSVLQHDTEHDVLKLNPLFDWKRDAVLSFATRNGVPLSELHAQGFVSIGCAPCTRAIAPGENERDGRWWWEQDGKKECGLHHKRAG